MSSLQNTGYESARPTHQCAASGRRFEGGERYVATLAENPETGEISRFDFTIQAWEGGGRPPEPLRVFAVWRTVAETAERSRSALVAGDELLQLFEVLEEAAEGRGAVFRYLVALLLMRKRQLQLVDQRLGEGGRPVLVLVRRAEAKDENAERFEVVDPGMDEQAIAVGMEELGAIVGGGEGP